MLHIKVLSYEEYDNTTLDNLDEKYFKLKKKEKTCTGFEDAEFLCDTHTVERRFIEILNTDFDAFRDEISCRLLKELDNSYRDNDYGIVTPMGKSCITCLSSEIKLALLIQYFSNRGTDIFVRFKIACKNIWIWLAKNADMTLYMREKDYRDTRNLDIFSYVHYYRTGENIKDLISVEYHGKPLDVYCSVEAGKMRSFTKDYENDLFRETFSGKKLLFFRKTEKLTMGEFIASFDVRNEVNDELCYWKDVHLMDMYDYTVTVPGNFVYTDEDETLECYMAIHYNDTMEYMGETYLDSSRHSHKNFLEVIMWETLAVDCCSYSWIKGIITDETKKALNDSYLDCVKWGFSIDTETKEIKICEPQQAITDFHEAVQHAVEDDETY